MKSDGNTIKKFSSLEHEYTIMYHKPKYKIYVDEYLITEFPAEKDALVYFNRLVGIIRKNDLKKIEKRCFR